MCAASRVWLRQAGTPLPGDTCNIANASGAYLYPLPLDCIRTDRSCGALQCIIDTVQPVLSQIDFAEIACAKQANLLELSPAACARGFMHALLD